MPFTCYPNIVLCVHFAALLIVTCLPCQALPTTASVTEPGRGLTRPLDIVLNSGGTEAIERTLLIVLDASPELSKANFADLLEQAILRSEKSLLRTRIGIGVIGQKGCIVLPPTSNLTKVVDEVRARLQKPGEEFQNVYADLRAVAHALSNTSGERSVLLVSLQNGDVEDDVDQVAQLLAKAKIKVSVLTREAMLADSYWSSHESQETPRGTTLTGSDGSVIDLPWGFTFQTGSANEITPAAFPMWGLARIAAATSGRAFIYSAPSQSNHQCGNGSECLFCNGDHLPPDSSWSESLVAQLGPLAASRSETLSALGRDPFFRALNVAWRDAADEGLVHKNPAIRLTGTAAAVDRTRDGRTLDLFSATNFLHKARRADEAAAKALSIGNALQSELARLGDTASIPRTEAAARYMSVLLQLTRVNLLLYSAWCREFAPQNFGKDSPDMLPPEVATNNGEQRPEGIGYSNMCLCHGVRPYLEIELPGGKALRLELEKLDVMFTAFMARYGKSQFGTALKNNGIARFWVGYRGAYVKQPRKRGKSTTEMPATVTPSRPTRANPSGANGTSGPTTGGR